MPQTDELFNNVAELLKMSQGKPGHDRRGRPRLPFEFTQLVAPFDGTTLPTQAEFERVLCHDLSTGGFSFFADRAPHCEHLVVALGPVPFTFFVAKIVRVSPAATKGRGKLLVGCEFTQRLQT